MSYSGLNYGISIVTHPQVTQLAGKQSRTKRLNHRSRLLATAFTIVAAFLATLQSTHAQISKGYQILLNRGLQLQGMVEWANYFHLDTYSNANYTSINWLADGSNPSLMGPPPGFPWSRWVTDAAHMPPQPQANGPVDESPYMSQLISIEMGDELNLNDGPTRTNEINWFNSVRSNFPNTILYINNYAGQVSDSALGDFIAKGQPDMICFDNYPFTSAYDTNYPNNIGPAYSWPFTSWFSELRRYRQWSIGTGIPFGTYMQTFHAVEDYDTRVYRDPSPSELRFNTSAALAFNAKVLTGFTYNTGAMSLFQVVDVGYSGDRYTNSLYGEQVDANRRAQNLGRALVCLKPIYDLHNPADSPAPPGPVSTGPNFPDGTTTSIMILQGRYLTGTTTNVTPPPISFQADPQQNTNVANPASLFYTWWEFAKNDPYLNGWSVTNKGTVNNGLQGQVIISWFTPLDESFDGPAYSNEIYMMVVNCLTATNGTAADCLQEIKLNFLTGTAISAVNMLDPETGLVTTNTMPVIAGSGSSTKRQLVLDLNGGDAALFKFADGAPFVGHIPPTRARLSASVQSGSPQLSLNQLTPGARYLLQTAPSLPSSNWTTLTGLVLTNSTYTFADANHTNTNYYRVVGIP